MGILSKSLGLETLSDTDPMLDEPSGNTYTDVRPPSRTSSGVTASTALSLPSVFRSVQISAGMGSQLVLNVTKAAQLIPTPNLCINPDPWRPLSEWIEQVIISLATDGNAFLLRVRKATDDGTLGPVVALIALNPFAMRMRYDLKNKRMLFDYCTTGEGVKTYTRTDIVHLTNLKLPGVDRGLGPIGHCRVSIEGHLDAREYGAGFLKSADVPSGTLTSEQPLDAAAMTLYKDEWKKGAAHEIRVLGRGLKYEPIMLSPEDAQFIEVQKFGVLDIARLFGLPAAYLHAGIEGSSLTYQNLEQVDAQFLRTTLFPVYLSKIENMLTAELPHGQTAKFDTWPLLRPDAKTRAQVHKINIESGVYDADEARAMEPNLTGPAPVRKEAVK